MHPAPLPALDADANRPASDPSGPERGVDRIPARSRDPHAAYDKAWLLEIPGRDPIGLDDGESVMLGRDSASPIGSWCDDNISRRHAEVRVDGKNLYARDLESTNGTFLNGERLEPRSSTPCHDGDVLQLATDNPVRLEVRGWG